MFSSDDDNQGLVLGVVFGVIALVIALVIGISIYTRNLVPAAKAPAVAVVVVEEVATVKVENGVVKFSGFHDASGDPQKNAELAKQRALAVRAVLVTQGVAEDKVELKKPEQALASGPAAEARRVEVTLK